MVDPVLTESRKETFLENLYKGQSVMAAAENADIVRETVYNWRRADPAFAEEWDKALLSRTSVVEDALFAKATKGGNVVAMIFWLCNRAPAAWRHVQHIQQSGQVEHIHTLDLRQRVQQVTDAVLKRLELPAPSGPTGNPDDNGHN